MIFESTPIQGLHVIGYNRFVDHRGEFVKTIHRESFEQAGVEWRFTESYFSVSAKDVIRGMHFQLPPADHDKLVYVIAGSITDVVLDIRRRSPTYGQYFATTLSADNRKAVYIPKGLAHGFVSLEPQSIVEYHTTTSQHKGYEGGILWNSFGYAWPVEEPILSERDQAFIPFTQEPSFFV